MSAHPDTQIALDVTETAFDAAFAALTLRRGLVHERYLHWPTAVKRIPRLGDVVASYRTEGSLTHVIERDCGALRVRVGDDGLMNATVAVAEREKLRELVALLRHAVPALPRYPRDSEQAVAISFWAMGPRGPVESVRRLAVPSWQEVAPNYPRAVGTKLEALFDARPPLPGGRLVLWHGPPGTGKTYALRALAWEWRDVVDVHYVVDAEAFLSQPAYLMRVLLGRRDPWDDAPEPDEDRFRLIVMEDAGELLAPDAKIVAGQGVARLLNLTDGLMGQARKALVLITGNEPLERLHPAVARAGRCAERVEFAPFDRAEAAEWLQRRGAATHPPQTATLADLYARLEGRAVAPARPAVGFAA